MRKGQGSLEYLLILAAILAIAVVVVVVANSMLTAPKQQTKLQQAKYLCGMQNIELVNYKGIIEGTVALDDVKYGGKVCAELPDDGRERDELASCLLQENLELVINGDANGCYFSSWELGTPTLTPEQ